MSLKFIEPKSINIGEMKKIAIKTDEGKPLYVPTEKCHSFGVKKDNRFDTTSMSVVLDENSVKKFEDVIEQCEKHLGKSFSSKILYRRDDGTVTVYPKFKKHTKLYENGNEIDLLKYERKDCDVRAVLEIKGIILNGEKANLQVKLYEALVREKVYEHVRLVDMEW